MMYMLVHIRDLADYDYTGCGLIIEENIINVLNDPNVFALVDEKYQCEQCLDYLMPEEYVY